MCKLEPPLLAPLESGSPLVGSKSLPESLPLGIGEPDRLTLIRGGTVLSMDARVGNFAVGDVLLKGSRILEVAPKIEAPDAAVIDANGHIVMPGFIDTHHHHFETALRGLLADAILLNDGRPSSAMNYYEVMLLKLSRVYRPEDVYINILYGSIAQLDAGVTTAMDVSQIHHSPEHSDAAVAALQDAGRRAVLGYFEGWGDKSQYPQDAARIRNQHFSSDDQLLTMVMGGEIYLPGFESAWRIGRELALPIAAHIVGTFGMAPTFDNLSQQNQFGSDNIFIHMTGMSDTAWQRAADSGAHVSLSVPIEMHMRHGTPPLQKALDLGMIVSLSSDVECTMTADMFTQMRSTITLQRMFANQLALEGKEFPSLMTVTEVLQMATLNGARGLRLEAKTGSLTPGKEADIILLDTNCLNTAPLNHAPGAVVTLMERSNVSTVICGGKVRKWKGELLGFDLEHLRRRLEQSRDYIFAAAGIEKDLFR